MQLLKSNVIMIICWSRQKKRNSQKSVSCYRSQMGSPLPIVIPAYRVVSNNNGACWPKAWICILAVILSNQDQQICSYLEDKLNIYAKLGDMSGFEDVHVEPHLLIKPDSGETPQVASLLAAALKEGKVSSTGIPLFPMGMSSPLSLFTLFHMSLVKSPHSVTTVWLATIVQQLLLCCGSKYQLCESKPGEPASKCKKDLSLHYSFLICTSWKYGRKTWYTSGVLDPGCKRRLAKLWPSRCYQTTVPDIHNHSPCWLGLMVVEQHLESTSCFR